MCNLEGSHLWPCPQLSGSTHTHTHTHTHTEHKHITQTHNSSVLWQKLSLNCRLILFLVIIVALMLFVFLVSCINPAVLYTGNCLHEANHIFTKRFKGPVPPKQWKFSHYPLIPMLMEKFCNPQNIFWSFTAKQCCSVQPNNKKKHKWLHIPLFRLQFSL